MDSSFFSADDWGLSPGVNEGILDLLKLGVVKRVSAMANADYLTHGLSEALQVPGVEWALHFNITYGKPLDAVVRAEWGSFPDVKTWLASGYLAPWTHGRRNELLALEFRAQLGRLQAEKIPITAFDGHQHMHLLPGLDSLWNSDLVPASIASIRVPYDPALWSTKKAIINVLSRRMLRKLKPLRYRLRFFHYPLSREQFTEAALRKAWKQTRNTEILVHPAKRADFAELGISDSYGEPRVQEYEALRRLGVALQ